MMSLTKMTKAELVKEIKSLRRKLKKFIEADIKVIEKPKKQEDWISRQSDPAYQERMKREKGIVDLTDLKERGQGKRS